MATSTISNSLSELLKGATHRGYLEDVKNLIGNQNLSGTDELGNTLLHISSGSGHASVVEFLLTKKEIKTNINSGNHIGDTALHKAAFRGFDDVVNLLLKNGANPTLTNKNDKTPADLTKSEIVLALLPSPKEEEIVMIDDDD